MPNLESKIRTILKQKKASLVAESVLDQNGSGVLAPDHVVPAWDELGNAPVEPHGALPDFGRGTKPGQAALPKTNATPGVGTVEGDGTTWDSVGNHVREADDKEDDDDKEDVAEDAKSENQRQIDKQKDGEKQHHVKGQDGDEDDKSPVNEASADDDDDKDEDDKKDMAEDVTALFAGEKLTEAFKKKATTIFEAAVNSRVKTIVGRKAAQLEESYALQINELKTALSDKVDSYLNYVTEEWMAENTIAIEKGIRAELTEEFIIGLKNLFTEHYIEVPQDKVDIVEALAEKVEELEEALNKSIDKGVKLQESVRGYERETILNESVKGLSTAQAEKMKQLAEGLEFKGSEAFKDSLTTLKESALVKPQGTKESLTEDVSGPLPVEDKKPKKSIHSEVNQVLEALKKTS